MKKETDYSDAIVKVYHGYGHKDNLIIYGHVLADKIASRKKYTGNTLRNAIHLMKLFFVEPVPGVRVQLQWGEQQLYTTTESDGFFKFEWQSVTDVAAGWHKVRVNLLSAKEKVTATCQGEIFVPHSTQYGFISDIDDTVLVSHSSTTGKKLRVMFTKNPRSRKSFVDVVKYYQLLALAHTEPNVPNPFFYVSSSEWNLYDDLNEFFRHNDLPKGAFLLNAIKKWYQLLQTGKTKHEGKLMRVARILSAFPKQRFVLLGDNSQKDPEIYALIANKYPDRVIALYIRNIDPEKEAVTLKILKAINDKNVHTCLFKHTDEAIQHSKSIGLLEENN
ncbi:App1 family protein [Runella sp.]|uniref:App1 family protein n=1 Tax=Runella sp. TaxID=1960881 RepID=UPI003D0D5782